MNLPIFPVLVPLIAALVLMLVRTTTGRFWVSMVAAALTLASSVLLLVRALPGDPLVAYLGAWPAPFGIAVVADGLSAVAVTLASGLALLATWYARGSVDALRERYGHHSLMQFLFAGVNLSFLTGDLFNLFVAFEVMLIASYVLVTLGGTTSQLKEGLRYVVFNLLVSALFVAAAGLTYGVLGTLNFADLAVRAQELGPTPVVTAVGLLLMAVFATKTALFPLSFWLQGAYTAAPPVVSAYFAAVLTKVGAYALIRTFTTVFPTEPDVTHTVLLALGAVTVLAGALGALTQRTWRAVLSFTVIASVGHLAIGLGLNTASGLSATVFYLMHTMLATFAVFVVAGVAERRARSTNVQAGGMLEVAPLLAGTYLLAMLAVGGIPPTSGFVGKFALVRAAFEDGGALPAAAAAAILLSSLIVLFTLGGVWRSYFWGKRASALAPTPVSMQLPVAVAAVALVALAALSGPAYELSQTVAAQLLDPTGYVRGVLP